MAQGFIQLHREIMEHPLLTNSSNQLSYFEAYLWLLMNASHSGEQFVFDGKVVKPRVGELYRSYDQLARAWGWISDRGTPNKAKVGRYLKTLCDLGDAELDSAKSSVYLRNYAKYVQNGNAGKPNNINAESAQNGTVRNAGETLVKRNRNAGETLVKRKRNARETEKLLYNNEDNDNTDKNEENENNVLECKLNPLPPLGDNLLSATGIETEPQATDNESLLLENLLDKLF